MSYYPYVLTQFGVLGIMLFYPWEIAKSPFVINVDAEMKDTIEVKEDVLDVFEQGRKEFGSAFPMPRVVFNDRIENVYAVGYSRMQYLGFYADKYIEEDYVMFVDSDAFFHSYVDREDLWENGKAIIQARFSHENFKLFREKTMEALGQEEFISCMAFFPVIIKRVHLPLIREAVRLHHNKSTFDEAYAAYASRDPGAQYNVMCTWLYLNRHDDYAWRIKDASPKWDGVRHPTPPPNIKPGNRNSIKPEDFRFTVPYLSDHCTYGLAPLNGGSGQLVPGFQDFKHTRRVLEHLLITSLCYLETKPPHSFKVAKNASRLSQWALSTYATFCPSYLQHHPYHEAWLRFENNDFRHLLSEEHKMKLKAVRESRIKNCEHAYIFV